MSNSVSEGQTNSVRSFAPKRQCQLKVWDIIVKVGNKLCAMCPTENVLSVQYVLSKINPLRNNKCLLNWT